MKQIGKVIHYYGKINVAILKLEDKLKIGDKIRIEKQENSFDMEVESMQVDHKAIEKAKKGDEVGIEVSEKASEDSIVYLLDS